MKGLLDQLRRALTQYSLMGPRQITAPPPLPAVSDDSPWSALGEVLPWPPSAAFRP